MKIISGAQTGADIAGIKIAKKHGFETGGYMPKGYITLDGFKPEYKDLYDMQETKALDYPTRTRMNVMSSDCTIWLGENKISRGKLCTFKNIKLFKKPYKDINIDDLPSIKSIVEWIVSNNFNVINIAGNSETLTNNMEEKVSHYLDKLFKKLKL
jgi:hypothetical protein